MAPIETGIQMSFLPLMNGHILSQNFTLLSHHNFVEKKNFITLITHTVFTENKEAREGLFSCLVHTYGLGFFTRTCVYKTNAGISTWIFKPVTEKHAGITEVVRCMSARALALSTYTHYIHSLGESIGSLSG